MKHVQQLLAISLLLLGCSTANGMNPFRTGNGGNRNGGNRNGGPANPFSQGGGGGGGGRGRRGNGGRRRDDGGCGGRRQVCCENSQCDEGLECLQRGDNSWFSAEKRCLRRKLRGNCGLEGLRCCRRGCLAGLECAAGKMCRKPEDRVEALVDPSASSQTITSFSGWVMVRVRAFGGKCFVRVRTQFEASVMSFGEGTFGEVFGALHGMGECEEGAQGRAIGYISADVLGSAILTEDGDCVSTADTEFEFGTKVRGEGITLTLGGGAGTDVGCVKRRRLLLLEDARE